MYLPTEIIGFWDAELWLVAQFARLMTSAEVVLGLKSVLLILLDPAWLGSVGAALQVGFLPRFLKTSIVRLIDEVTSKNQSNGEFNGWVELGRRLGFSNSITSAKGTNVSSEGGSGTNQLDQVQSEVGPNYLNSLLDAMGDAIVAFDRDGVLTLQNPMAEQLFGNGKSKTAATWFSHMGFLDPNDGSPLEFETSPIQDALRGKPLREVFVAIEMADESPSAVDYQNRPDDSKSSVAELHFSDRSSRFDFRVLSVTAGPLRDQNLHQIGTVLCFHDVTSLRAAEDQARRAKLRAEDGSIAKTEFLANISHEIRTPMNSILGYADRLSARFLSSSQEAQWADIIRRNGDLLIGIIDDLLDISKIEAGCLPVSRERFLLPDIARDVMAMLEHRAREKHIGLHVHHIGELPRSIETDPIRLRQILLNIVGNAVKFTSQGAVDVSIRYDYGRAKLAITVEDTGCGIAPEMQDRIFRPFAQADGSATRKYGGTGLGLNLSKRLSQLMGGELSLVESRLNYGTTFVVEINAPDPRDSMLDTRSVSTWTFAGEQHRRRVNSTALKGLRILVVEDGPENLELFAHYLGTAGADVKTAVDGEEGVALAMAERFDAIVMDLQMPRMDGYQAVKLLRSQGSNLPIVALTAHAMPEERRRCLKSGFDGHLAKPITAIDLVEGLKGIVRRLKETGRGDHTVAKTNFEAFSLHHDVDRVMQTAHKALPMGRSLGRSSIKDKSAGSIRSTHTTSTKKGKLIEDSKSVGSSAGRASHAKWKDSSGSSLVSNSKRNLENNSNGSNTETVDCQKGNLTGIGVLEVSQGTVDARELTASRSCNQTLASFAGAFPRKVRILREAAQQQSYTALQVEAAWLAIEASRLGFDQLEATLVHLAKANDLAAYDSSPTELIDLIDRLPTLLRRVDLPGPSIARDSVSDHLFDRALRSDYLN